MDYQITYRCYCHTGNLRRSNQDNFLCDSQYMQPDNGTAPIRLSGTAAGENAVFGVFDGMGGEEKGEVAAHIAAETAAAMDIGAAPLEDLFRFCQRANRRICGYIAEENLRAMGTTAAMVCFFGGEAHLCNIGDSSIFRHRRGQLCQLSQSHTFPGAYGTKPALSQYLGIPEQELQLEPHLCKEPLHSGDVYLLCSDGLTDMLSREAIEQILNAVPFEDAAGQLLERALERGGKDNITLILCRVEAPDAIIQAEAKEKGKPDMTEKEIPVTQNTPQKKTKGLLLILALILAAAATAVLWYLNTPKEICVATEPHRTEYALGDRLEMDGLALEITYHSGKQETVTQGFACDPLILTAAGEQQITVTCNGMTTAFSVEAVPVLEEIRVAAQPDKVWYVLGESPDMTGLTLEASYNDGSTEILTEGFSWEDAPLTAVGKQNITVSYEDKTAEIAVEVAEVTAIYLKSPAARQDYMVGQTLEPEGIILTAVYSDGSRQDIREGFDCEAITLEEEGEQRITVRYEGKETEFPVTVHPPVTFSNLQASGTSVRHTDGTGYNQNHGPVTWAIIIEHELDPEIREVFRPGISCSWDDVVNGDRMGQSCTFDSAKEGITFAEYGTYVNSDRFMYILYLPDDPSIAGEQSAEIYVGNCTKTITFTLTYVGDYTTGNGWRVSDIKF